MESSLQAKCFKEAKARGVLAFKLVAVGRRGFPDVGLYFPGGKHVLVELKTPTGRLSPQQKRSINKLRKQGVVVHVIDTIEAFTALLEFYR